MIVWGGSWLDQLNTGGIYHPGTDTWEETSTGPNLPEVRDGHTAVWTGSEMIVWGGYAGDGEYLETGGHYNPALDTWAPTEMVGAPAARTGHTAVWTGGSECSCKIRLRRFSSLARHSHARPHPVSVQVA